MRELSMRIMDSFCPSGIQTILLWSSSRRFHDIAPCSRTQEHGLLRSHTVYSKRQCMVADLLRRASENNNPSASISRDCKVIASFAQARAVGGCCYTGNAPQRHQVSTRL